MLRENSESFLPAFGSDQVVNILQVYDQFLMRTQTFGDIDRKAGPVEV